MGAGLLRDAAHPSGRARGDDGVRRARRARGGGALRVLPGARLVLGALLGRERVPGIALVGVRAAAGIGCERQPRSGDRCRVPVGARDPRARDRALLPARRRRVDGLARDQARGRTDTGRALRADRSADGRALDPPQLRAVRRGRAGVDRGRAEPVPGERAALAAGGVRPLRGRAGPHRAVPLRPARGPARDPRPPAVVDRGEARRADAYVLGSGEHGGHPRQARRVRTGAAAGRRGGRGRHARAVPRRPRVLRGRARAPRLGAARPLARLVPRVLQPHPRRHARLQPLPDAGHADRVPAGGVRVRGLA